MAKEIERKFLVKNSEWKHLARGTYFAQGYLNTDPNKTVRVRLEGENAKLTIKGKTQGCTRLEYEFPIDYAEAKEILTTLCAQTSLSKLRYRVKVGEHVWEIDEFLGTNAGLIVAEVELQSENETLTLPDWVGREVTGDPRYYNSNLVSNPYTTWKTP